jgi:hypothetical protein
LVMLLLQKIHVYILVKLIYFVKHDLKGSVKVYRVESCTLHVPTPQT